MRGGVMTRRKMVRIHPPAPIGRLIAAPTGCGASDEKEQPLSQPAADSSPYKGEPICGYGVMAARQLPKLYVRVRVPLSAPLPDGYGRRHFPNAPAAPE